MITIFYSDSNRNNLIIWTSLWSRRCNREYFDIHWDHDILTYFVHDEHCWCYNGNSFWYETFLLPSNIRLTLYYIYDFVLYVPGIVFSEAPFTAVYTGIWGYNALLSASAVGGFFIVLTCHSFWNALANVLFTVVVQQTLIIAFKSVCD